MKRYYWQLFLLLSICLACNKPKNTLIDGNLRAYVDRFYEEGASRGIEMSKDNLEVVFRDLSAEAVCGLGDFSFDGLGLRKVEISPEPFCWGGRSEWSRENLIFHELGHAVLKRRHENNKLPNGLPENMMCGSGACDNFSLYGQYTLGKRKYYLDKLFNPLTPVPTWGRIKHNASIFFEDDFEQKSKSGQFVFSDNTFADNYDKRQTINIQTQSNSIKLSSIEQQDNNASAAWEIRIPQPSIEEGLGLKLSINVTADNLVGEGAAIFLNTYSGNREFPDLSETKSTRRINKITGTEADRNIILEIPYFPSEVQELIISLTLLPNTSGSVYFDDLSLTVLDN